MHLYTHTTALAQRLDKRVQELTHKRITRTSFLPCVELKKFFLDRPVEDTECARALWHVLVDTIQPAELPSYIPKMPQTPSVRDYAELLIELSKICSYTIPEPDVPFHEITQAKQPHFVILLTGIFEFYLQYLSGQRGMIPLSVFMQDPSSIAPSVERNGSMVILNTHAMLLWGQITLVPIYLTQIAQFLHVVHPNERPERYADLIRDLVTFPDQPPSPDIFERILNQHLRKPQKTELN